MTTSLAPLTIASIVFLVLYTAALLILLAALATKRISIKSRWSLLLFHVSIRLAAQCVGIAFGILSFTARPLLIAYLVLSTEGYFTLVLSLTLFFIHWQRKAEGASWLARDDLPLVGKGKGWRAGLKKHFDPREVRKRPIDAGQHALLIANVLIVTGSSLLASSTPTGPDGKPVVSPGPLLRAQGMRGTGQTIFLLCNLAIMGCLVWTLVKRRRSASQSQSQSQSEREASETTSPTEGRRSPTSTLCSTLGSSSTTPTKKDMHRPILLLFLCISLLLTIRGGFGVAQGVVWDLNYYNAAIYNDQGFLSSYVVEETLLATLPEWSSCMALIASGVLGWRMQRREGEGEVGKEGKDLEAGKEGVVI